MGNRIKIAGIAMALMMCGHGNLLTHLCDTGGGESDASETKTKSQTLSSVRIGTASPGKQVN